jgi:uncharacterized protein (UPF0333 family)
MSKLKKGQSTLEYAILVVIIIGALIAINAYIRGGIAGRAKTAADDIGDQYDPGNMNAIKMTNTSSNTYEEASAAKGSLKVQLSNEWTNTYMSQNIQNTAQTSWGG